MRRRLGIAALAIAGLGLVTMLTFPTDALVRAALARIPLPDGMQLLFAGAQIRPSGIRFDDVHVVRRDGEPAFDALWLSLRPSLMGLWRDGTGRPWRVRAAACQGEIDLTIGAERDLTAVTVVLDQVELASCLPYVRPGSDAYGRVTGTISARAGAGAIEASEATLDLRGAAWTPGDPLPGVRLRADAGTLRWRLVDRRLELTTIEASSDDFQAAGSGWVRFVSPIDDSAVDVRLAVTPGPTMPPLLRRYLDAIPGASPNTKSTRTLRLEGTLRDPRLTARGTIE